MTGPELGLLLLCCHMGDPARPVLSVSQLAALGRCMRHAPEQDPEGEVDVAFLRSIGCDESLSVRVVELLEEESRVLAYLEAAGKRGYQCLTRRSPEYPRALSLAMGEQAPPVLWMWGEREILDDPALSLVGSRNAEGECLDFARAVGKAAAVQSYTLVSGGARGVDRAGQDACLNQGGRVVCVVPDSFTGRTRPHKRLMYLCEDSFDFAFSSQRALSRNHIIHSLGLFSLVAQCGLSGGTWSGTTAHLKRACRPVYAFRGCDTLKELRSLGAGEVDFRDLTDLGELTVGTQMRFF